MKDKKYHIIYWSIVCFCILLVLGLNLAFSFQPSTLLWFFITFSIVVFVTFILAYFFGLLPEKFYNAKRRLFKVHKCEKKIYEKLQIKKWKDKIPELGKMLTGFDKSTIAEPNNPEYISKFLVESCKGSFLHITSIVYSALSIFIVIWFLPWPFILTMWLPIALVAMTLHSLSTMILRYNRAKLLVVYERLIRNNNMKNKAEN